MKWRLKITPCSGEVRSQTPHLCLGGKETLQSHYLDGWPSSCPESWFMQIQSPSISWLTTNFSWQGDEEQASTPLELPFLWLLSCHPIETSDFRLRTVKFSLLSPRRFSPLPLIINHRCVPFVWNAWHQKCFPFWISECLHIHSEVSWGGDPSLYTIHWCFMYPLHT